MQPFNEFRPVISELSSADGFWLFMAMHGVWLTLFLFSVTFSVVVLAVGSNIARELSIIAQILAMQVETSQRSIDVATSPAATIPIVQGAGSRALTHRFGKR